MATLNWLLFLIAITFPLHILFQNTFLSLQSCTLKFIFMQYLTGAPFAWAGLSRTVMVVAVSLRKASDPSYFAIVGAGERASVSNAMYHLTNSLTLIISKWGQSRQYQTWNISRHVHCGCLAESFGGGRTYRELIRDARVELGKEVVGGVGRQGHCQSWPLKSHWGIKRMQATAADLWQCRQTECWCRCSQSP